MEKRIIFIRKKPKVVWFETITEYLDRGGVIKVYPTGEMTPGITFHQWGKLKNHATKNGKANSQKNCWSPDK